MDVGAGALDGPWGGGDLGFDNPSVSCADSSLYTREPGAYGIRESPLSQESEIPDSSPGGRAQTVKKL